MKKINNYPVFVADQVLTAEHLNQVRDYLEEENRLTRNKLIGIGIVCGLTLKVTNDTITITKGCGVTSEGYLITQDADKEYNHYRSYNLPEHFSSDYKEDYEVEDSEEVWELLPNNDYEEAQETKKGFLENKIVVLLLEKEKKPLKNCIELDCEDKGDRVEFNLKPLLVSENYLETFIEKTKETYAIPGENTLPFRLKRLDISIDSLKSTDQVLGLFETANKDFKVLAPKLNHCFENYWKLLEIEGSPIQVSFTHFEQQIKKTTHNNPYYLQYLYDWLADLIRAYNEFQDKAIDTLQTKCCPEKELFPLHLMLGKTDESTLPYTQNEYRNYFIYSPLFDKQNNGLKELRFLFERLIEMIKTFTVPAIKKDIKITPSQYGNKLLGERCIPYYYDAKQIHKIWNWDKTRKGRAQTNLSYNALEYSDADTPFDYDIEPYNFFRIEGHVGKSYTDALKVVIKQRNDYNLPFDVIALSTANVNRFINAKDHRAYFQDIQTAYEVLVAELSCKFGAFTEMAAKIKMDTSKGNQGKEAKFTGMDMATASGLLHNMGPAATVSLYKKDAYIKNQEAFYITQMQSNVGREFMQYNKGEFVKEATQKTEKEPSQEDSKETNSIQVGMLYVNAIDNGYVFYKPSIQVLYKGTSASSKFKPSDAYALLLHFIDVYEETIEVFKNNNLQSLDWEIFKKDYGAVINAIRDLDKAGKWLREIERSDEPENENSITLEILKNNGFFDLAVKINTLLGVCIDDKLSVLKKEYEERLKEFGVLTNLTSYFENHPGMEHKAGVPKGGTFILIYHETQSQKDEKTSDSEQYKERFAKPLQRRERFAEPQRRGEFDKAQTKNKFSQAKQKEFNNILDVLQDRIGINIDEKRLRVLFEKNPEIFKAADTTPFKIKDKTIIADFYLPYICCSGTPSISYVLPKEPIEEVENLTIEIEKTEFCSDDENKYLVTVSPPGGKLKGALRGISQEDSGFYFIPMNQSEPGENTLTYHVNNQTKQLDVKVIVPDTSFYFKIEKEKVDSSPYLALDKIPKILEIYNEARSIPEVLTYSFQDKILNNNVESSSLLKVFRIDFLLEMVVMKTIAPQIEANRLDLAMSVKSFLKYILLIDTNKLNKIVNILRENNLELPTRIQTILEQAKNIPPVEKEYVINEMEKSLSQSPFLMTFKANEKKADGYIWNISVEEKNYLFRKFSGEVGLPLDWGTIQIKFEIIHDLPSGKCNKERIIDLDRPKSTDDFVDMGWFDQNKELIDQPE